MQDPPNTSSFRGAYHRRAHSEVHFRIPDDLDLVSDPLFPSSGTGNFDDDDDLFNTFMDIENIGSKPQSYNPNKSNDEDDVNGAARSRHRHSASLDGSNSSALDSIEAKKAMPPHKLAELWTIDPKKAKRIIANRQSASRSKERKARYITELERKVQTLQTEATTLSAQLSLFQRDTTGLNTENTELKFRLQALEQQAQLRDALNEALKKDVDRLKVVTGEAMTPTDSYNLGMHQFPYTQNPFFPAQQQPGPSDNHNIQMSQFQPFTPSHMVGGTMQPHGFSEMLQHDPLGRFQGLDINNRSSNMVKNEGPLVSTSESSSTF